MSTLEFLTQNPELANSIKLEVNGADLLAFGEAMHKRFADEVKPALKEEEYLTPAQFAEILHVSLVTLWSWDKKGITQPVRIGNKKLYRRSDLEKILTRG